MLFSCGQVVPQVQIRVVDAAGNDVPAGEPGELLIKSPTVFGGYWKRPDLSAKSLEGGWLRIGDVGTLSSDGWLTVLGRKPDLLQRNGRVIYPRRVEEAVHEHPAVKEATYVQRPNGNVMAFSLRHAYRRQHSQEYWASELARHLRERVPDWQLPDSYALFDELPRSRLGKVLRREVRDILAPAPAAARRAIEPERSFAL
jgi:acyl-CoA synthetase (AMP-forming)/AMP-acid ligase II